MPTKRMRLTLALAATSVAALGLGAAAESAATQTPGSVGITAFPTTIAVGQVVLISGFVVDSNDQRVGGAEVTVKRYSAARCATAGTPLTVITTEAGGDFSFSDVLTVNPPVSYGFFYALSQDPGRAPDFESSDACVTIGSGTQVSAQTQGDVLVDGAPFTGGVIDYGSTVDLKPRSHVKLSADVGHVDVYTPPGQETSFVVVRTSEKKKGKTVRIVEFSLVGGDFTSCKGKKTNGFRTESGKKPRPKRSLWASGKGHYRTKGKYSSATVLGTIWFTQDTCDGTLTIVKRGVVEVRDLVRHKTILVKAGHKYLVRAPG